MYTQITRISPSTAHLYRALLRYREGNSLPEKFDRNALASKLYQDPKVPNGLHKAHRVDNFLGHLLYRGWVKKEKDGSFFIAVNLEYKIQEALKKSEKRAKLIGKKI